MAIVIYAPGLNAPFIFDDVPGIINNENIRQLWPLSESLSATPESPAWGRPLVAFSLAMTYNLAELNYWPYHEFNLVVHILNAILAFALIRFTLTQTQLKERLNIDDRSATLIAVSSALLWSAHPLQTEAVQYISQRTELLFTLFALLTVYLFAGKQYIAAAITCTLGILCKEMMVLVPLIVLLYDRTFLAGTFVETFKQRKAQHALIFATCLVGIAMILMFPRVKSTGYEDPWSAWTYLLTQSQVLTDYLIQFVWPTALSIDLHYDPVTSLADVLLPGLFIVALLAATVFCLVRKPAIGFCAAACFIVLAPTSSIYPILTEVAADDEWGVGMRVRS